MNFIINRLKEKSTWTVLLGALGIFAGINLSPEMSEKILEVGPAVIGLIIVFLKEKEVKPKEVQNEQRPSTDAESGSQSITTPELTDEQRAQLTSGG